MLISRTEMGSVNNNVILVDIPSDNTFVILLENYKLCNQEESGSNPQ